jgi:uncharacterized SAM-dependent methyltransferase
VRIIVKVILFGLLLSLAKPSLAQDINNTTTLDKKDFTHINIFSSEADQIHMYLTDQKQQKYHISAVSQKEAEQILNRIKSDTSIIFKTAPVDNKSYLKVTSWQ